VGLPLSDGRYEVIAGERRWRAAQVAGLATVPAVLRSEDEMKRLQMALVENMAREELNPITAESCGADRPSPRRGRRAPAAPRGGTRPAEGGGPPAASAAAARRSRT